MNQPPSSDRLWVFIGEEKDGSGCYERLMSSSKHPSRNVLGEVLLPCSARPVTGFFRNGCCDTSDDDRGSHTVCAVMTDEFLAFSSSCGNDLSTPVPQHGFPGLKAGDRWCLCAPRWQEAWEAGKAPHVILQSSHEGALAYVTIDDLISRAIDVV